MLRTDPEEEEREWSESFAFLLPQPRPLIDFANDVDPFETKLPPPSLEEATSSIQQYVTLNMLLVRYFYTNILANAFILLLNMNYLSSMVI